MRYVILMLVGVLFAGCCTTASIDRYVHSVNIPVDVYTRAVDPNDTIYRGLSRPSAMWFQSYGDNERSLMIHSLVSLQQRCDALAADLSALEEQLKESEE